MATWQLDKSHSAIEFAVRHMMISKTRGRFESFDGSFELDEQNPANSRVNVTIDTASINTRDAQRDGHLRSPDFFAADQYPQARFESTRVEVTGKNTAKLHGNLTIRDITRPVVVDVTYVGTSVSPWGQSAYGFEGRTKINRKDWGLTWNVALETGGVLVGEEVELNLEVELIKEPAVEAVAV